MGVAFVLLGCVCKAIVKNAARGVVNALSLGVGGDILADAWDLWQQARKEEQRPDDVQALAAAPPVEVAAAAAEIAKEEGGHLADADKETLTEYLRQIPAMIQRSQRRPADPEGKTVLPGTTFKKKEDLYPMLPPQPPRFKPGDQPIGDWQLDKLLGRGGFGEVWLARNPFRPSTPPVALKFCLDNAAAKALRNEVRLLDRVEAQSRHPGIVQLLRTHLKADPPCLEYEYVPDGDLGGYIREKRLKGGLHPLPAGHIIQRLGEIVGFTHRLPTPIVHRDLKPSNVLVHEQSANKVKLKITDFGIGGMAIQQARDASRQQTRMEMLTSAELGACTPLYASPQQMRNEAPDPRDDVYALGVIWYQLLTGDLTQQRPGGDAWRKRLAVLGMTPELTSLLATCFEDEREDRPADGAALAEQLASLLAKLPPPPPPPPRVVTKPADTPPPTPEQPPIGPSKTFTNSVGMTLMLIPAGTFLMGSPEAEVGRQACEGPQHGVTISRPFYLGIHPVTQRQYEAVMGTNPSLFAGNPDHPVERVSWANAVEFCTRLWALTPEKEASRAYRLPTEAEWEFACRGGAMLPFRFGKAASASACSTDANFDGNYPYGGAAKGPYVKQTSKVGSYAPKDPKERHPWGLCDMHGNVREWCADWFAEDYYRKRENTDPKGPPDGDRRVLRGGSWGSKGKSCRAAFREGQPPDSGNSAGFGFRVVCAVAAS